MENLITILRKLKKQIFEKLTGVKLANKTKQLVIYFYLLNNKLYLTFAKNSLIKAADHNQGAANFLHSNLYSVLLTVSLS